MNRLLIFLLLIITASSCSTDEIGPDINFNDFTAKDTTYIVDPVPAPEPKRVLVEESTGVKCPNCPKGTQQLKDLDASYSDKLDIISIHYGGGILNFPYENEQDLRPISSIGDAYIALLGGNTPQPAASIDRQEFGGKLLNNRTTWANQIADRLAVTTPINIDLSASNDVDNEQLILEMKLTYTEDSTSIDPDSYSIIILENDIEGKQDSVGIEIEYVFEDVFRTFITAVSGEQITAERVAGRVIEKTFLIPYGDLNTRGQQWEIDNLVAVVFVHKTASNDLTVLQSKEVHF